MISQRRPLKTGDVLQVRSREEILATLDENGSLERLPFMPEMLAYAGKSLRVASVAHKTCDTIRRSGGRRMKRTVHLEGVRCDGSAHGGCEARCLIFWKEDWLKHPDDPPAVVPTGRTALNLAATVYATNSTAKKVYRCQATELLEATEPLSGSEARQYVADLRSGNASLWRLIRALSFAAFQWALRFGVGYRLLIRTYNSFQKLVGGCAYPVGQGQLSAGTPTPVEALHLKPGDLVTVKSHAEILATLNTNNKNRGLWFDAEMVPYCGGEHRVLHRVEKIINETNGEMVTMKTPCIILDGVVCKSAYSEGRLLCPRAIYAYWREAWLRRSPVSTSERPDPSADG